MGLHLQLPSFKDIRILVVGELVLDKYIWGTVERISPEAPIPVVRMRRRETRPGNAAFVCATARSLGASVALVSVVGADVEGQGLRNVLKDLDISDDGIVEDPSRPTIVKERLLASVQSAMRGTQQLLRLDREDPRPVDLDIEESLLRSLAREMPLADGILVCDINKGLLTPRVLRSLIDEANAHRIPVIIDPRLGDDLSIYRGATALTPNRYEAERATRLHLSDKGSWEAASRKLVDDLALDLCVVTLDRDGMFLCERSGTSKHLPTTPLEVYDVTGAGDVALSVFGLCLVAGMTAADAGGIANVAAGLEVGKQGASVLSADELNAAVMGERADVGSKLVLLKDLADTLARHRDVGGRVCFTLGRFDALCLDDVRMLEFARSQADVLVVGVSADNISCDTRTAGNAVDRAVDRAALVGAVQAVDYVTIYYDSSAADLVSIVKPHVVVTKSVKRTDMTKETATVDAYDLTAVMLNWSDKYTAHRNGI